MRPHSVRWSEGDLAFVGNAAKQTDPFDLAIAASGAATIQWMKQHGMPPSGKQVTIHVAMATQTSDGGLAFVEAIPEAGVVITPANDFFHREPPGTMFYKGGVQVAADSAGRAGRAAPAAGGFEEASRSYDGRGVARATAPRAGKVTGATLHAAGISTTLTLAPPPPPTVHAKAVAAARSKVGSAYADEFQTPSSGRFYCSSLIEWAYAKAAGRERFFINQTFTMLFIPIAFWQQYYAEANLTIPINATGSNPTLLLHSPLVRFSRLNSTTLGLTAQRKV